MYLEEVVEEQGLLLKAVLKRLEVLEKTQPVQDEWMTVEQAIAITGWSKSAVYSTHLQHIERSKRGKRIYLKRSSLMEYLSEKRVLSNRQIESKADTYLMRKTA